MKKCVAVLLLFLLVPIVTGINADGLYLDDEYAFIVNEAYETITITCNTDGVQTDVVSEDETICKIGFVITDAKNNSLIIAGDPVKPGKTYFSIRNKKTGDVFFYLPVIVPGDDSSSTSAQSDNSDPGLKAVIDSMSELGDLDTNGNGKIDFEEMFSNP